MLAGIDVVIDYVESHQSAIALRIAHHDGQLQQLRCDVRVFYAEQDLLVSR